MAPAGLMWSVVTESPKIASGRASRTSHQSSTALLKFSIAGETTGRDQIVITKDLFDVWIEWSRITDTSCATITHQIEPQLVEIFLQASLLKIFSYHSRAGRQ